MSRLTSLFEEDIEMQDALEDLETLTDDSEDILLLGIEENYNAIKANEVHLFANEAMVNKDGLTPEEEAQIAAAFLDDEISEKTMSPEEIEELEKEFLDDDIDDLVDEDY